MEVLFIVLLLQTIVQAFGYNSSAAAIIRLGTVSYDSSFKLYYDPPEGHFAPTALGMFVWSNFDGATFYYDDNGQLPTFNSSKASVAKPYIQITTPFKASRNRSITVVGVLEDSKNPGSYFRTQQHTIKYFVEASARASSYGYLVPGIESGGYFLQFQLEVAATARAQPAGSQEFADFNTNLGVGTYSSQIQALHLPSIDSDLTGFEGGFPYNTTDNRYYGVLIPYHNGNEYFGKVVRIDLKGMSNASECIKNYLIESMNSNGVITKIGPSDSSTACVHILDLATLHPFAKGFRKGFNGYPFGYLSAGAFSVIARLDLENYGLATTKLIDLGLVDSTFGGYSGGFADGLWSCYTPYRSFAGEIGGTRSSLVVDKNNLRSYYNSVIVCVNSSAWHSSDPVKLSASIKTMDLSTIDESLRGFSDAVRIGRYAYLTPMNSADFVYSCSMVRVNLGTYDIGTTINDALSTNGNIRSIIDILNLAKVNSGLCGFSSLFSSGQYLLLVPYRNSYEPQNGQRGHGNLVRLNMNDYSVTGVEYIDLASTTRNQIPSFADTNLRGFSYGFASGQYGLLVPFYNADFNGKVARFLSVSTLSTNLQELDLLVDRKRPRVYKGYRGGFVSIWQGVSS